MAEKETVAKLKIVEIPLTFGTFFNLWSGPHSLTQPNIHGTVGLQKPHKHGSNEDDRHLCRDSLHEVCKIAGNPASQSAMQDENNMSQLVIDGILVLSLSPFHSGTAPLTSPLGWHDVASIAPSQRNTISQVDQFRHSQVP